MLGTSDVKVTTGAGAVGISIASPLSWGSSNRLTLDAKHSVTIRSRMIVEGTGGLTITIDDAAGAFNIYPQGSVTFWDTTSSLIINGNAYTLVNDIATLAADVAANNTGYFALAKDYDASVDGTYTAAPISTVFEGTMEGLGHVISNLTISTGNSVYYVGLFARTYRVRVIRDIGLENVQVSSDSTNFNYTYVVGALVGEFKTLRDGSNILNVHVQGSISTAHGGGDVGGLIGHAMGYGTPNNITQSRCDCSVTGGYAGGLLGYGDGANQIAGSHTSGFINGVVAGGLLGESHTAGNNGITAITDSYSSASITGGGGYAGGLAGATDGSISGSHAVGSISACIGYGGGLAGFANTIADSHATGPVSSACPNAGVALGGLAGEAGGVIRSFATGPVSGGGGTCTGALGGLIGFSGGIQTSYATGTVSNGGGPSCRMGGLAGLSLGSISNSYALGSVQGGPSAEIGGLVGFFNAYGGSLGSSYSVGAVSGSQKLMGGSVGQLQDGVVEDDDYWDVVTSGTHRSAGGTGLRTYEFKAGLPPGFDSAIWGQQRGINKGYPYLLALPPR